MFRTSGRIGHTLEIGLVDLLGDAFHLLISELVGKIEHRLAGTFLATLIGVFTLG
jgi:hypothetical protein